MLRAALSEEGVLPVRFFVIINDVRDVIEGDNFLGRKDTIFHTVTSMFP